MNPLRLPVLAALLCVAGATSATAAPSWTPQPAVMANGVVTPIAAVWTPLGSAPGCAGPAASRGPRAAR